MMLQPASRTSFIQGSTVRGHVVKDGGYGNTVLDDNTTRVQSNHGKHLTRCGEPGERAISLRRHLSHHHQPSHDDFNIQGDESSESIPFPFTLIILQKAAFLVHQSSHMRPLGS